MASQAFSETLQFVTQVKLRELEKSRVAYVSHVDRVFSDAKKHDENLPEKLEVLLEGVKSWPGKWSGGASVNLENLEQWVRQAKCDPSMPRELLQEWISKLEAQFIHGRTRYDYAKLFGNLVTDWIQSSASHLSSSEGTGISEPAVKQETIDEQERLAAYIFEEKHVDVDALSTYLSSLFSSPECQEALSVMRNRIKSFGESLRKSQVTDKDMTYLVKSLIGSDVLSDAKLTTLKQFAQNPTCVEELASVLNMQLASLATWAWPEEGVLAEPRRHLNGKTRFFLDEEILTALLLQYIGLQWSGEFKSALLQLCNSPAWKDAPRILTKQDWSRRSAFLKEDLANASRRTNIYDTRKTCQKNEYFMSQLPGWDTNALEDYSGVDFDVTSTPLGKKQSLLHLLGTEVLLNKTLHGRCTVVCTDLERFGPSLPHTSILTLLRFFGMPEIDLAFIRTFLACPMRFKDDPTILLRKRGAPIYHALSFLCGEVLLAVMDFAVNQKTNGLYVYRLYDDFWFWDPDSDKCAVAWKEMERYAELTGITFNKGKTGSLAVSSSSPSSSTHPDLPVGPVRWGSMQMSPLTGRFEINPSLLPSQIAEISRQLSATTSIFAWSQAYNKSLGFFVRNCGEPAMVSGKKHVDDMLSTLVRIQAELFPGTKGSFVEALAKRLEEEFGVGDVPVGWYLWPNAIGGLEIHDYIVDLLAKRDKLPQDPEQVLRKAMEEDEKTYASLKLNWETGKVSAPGWDSGVSLEDPFLPYSEYVLGRVESSPTWAQTYTNLQTVPSPLELSQSPTADLSSALRVLGRGLDAFTPTGEEYSSWDDLSAYWKWIVSLHCAPMMERFGSLAVVDPAMIPVGMVSVFRGTKMRWD